MPWPQFYQPQHLSARPHSLISGLFNCNVLGLLAVVDRDSWLALSVAMCTLASDIVACSWVVTDGLIPEFIGI